MKRIATVLSLSILVVAMLAFPAYAEDPANVSSTSDTQLELFSDGSYAIIDTTIEYATIYDQESVVATNAIAVASTSSTKTASATYTYYSNSGDKKWSLTVTGRFSYNGSTSKATSASVSHKIFGSGWSCSDTSHSISGATAKATGTFKYGFLTKNAAIGLKCSAKGTITTVNY
ncbi:MAG: hypothetical protein PHG06_22950 [Parabacteroides sp.]|jgi:hypothetical protein|uniref:DUF5626 domain-containing protein n=1 Tax=Aminicella lysinilytica TaxID=433323 RepID=A0A4R6PZN2_9FIRM|nr:hypothetical protein [Aminicella lysinilytica]MDD4593249.1 hypothetical protein [Parabacteroides sp.]TDP51845.1 hypothetical protein EV211_12923 [Aminicella lysinilytica]